MKKRSLFPILSLILLLAAAFVGPRLLLRQAQSSVLDRPRLLDASAWLLEGSDGDLVKKLNALTHPVSQTVELYEENADEGALRAAFLKELELLGETGAVPASLPALARDAKEFLAVRLCVFNPAQSLLFELYEFELPGERIHARMDRSTGKLLFLGFTEDPAAEETDLLFSGTDPEAAAKQAAAWAEYYGLSVSRTENASREELSTFLEEIDRMDYLPSTPLLRVTFRDGAGEEAVFCLWLSVQSDAWVFGWQPGA